MYKSQVIRIAPMDFNHADLLVESPMEQSDGNEEVGLLAMPAEILTQIFETCESKTPEKLRLTCKSLNNVFLANEHKLATPLETRNEDNVFVEFETTSSTDIRLHVTYNRVTREAHRTNFINPTIARLTKFFKLAKVISIKFNNFIPELTESKIMKDCLTECRAKQVTIRSNVVENLWYWPEIFPKTVPVTWNSTPEVFQQGMEIFQSVTGMECNDQIVPHQLVRRAIENRNLSWLEVKIDQIIPLEKYLAEWVELKRDISYWFMEVRSQSIAIQNRHNIERVKEGVEEQLNMRISLHMGVCYIHLTLCH